MTAVRRDLCTGIVIAVIGVIYFGATFSIQETADIVTPRTFPAIVGFGLIVLGLFLAGQAWWTERRAVVEAGRAGEPGHSDSAATPARESATDSETKANSTTDTVTVILAAPEEPRGRNVVIQFALFFVYLAILIPVGFLLSTAAFLMTVTSLYAPARWIRNLVFSVLFAVIVYVAFVYGLAVYLPVGILG